MSAFSVSIKAVLADPTGRVALLKNERGEWELPGGKLEEGEQPSAVVERELREELGLDVRCGPILDSWLFEVLPARHVFVVTYAATTLSWEGFRHSDEHHDLGLFSLPEIERLRIPAGYVASIRRCLETGGGSTGG